MKKIICLVMALTMVLALAACSVKNQNITPSTEPSETTTESTTAVTEPAQELVADTLVDKFQTLANEEGATPESILNTLKDDPMFADMMLMVQEMQAGYLPGFTEDVDGFETCYTMAPAIGSIPFISYIFTLAEDADVDAFIATLNNLHALNWNICTAADTMRTAVVGNMVFFVMAPASFEQEEEPEGEVEQEYYDAPLDEDAEIPADEDLGIVVA